MPGRQVPYPDGTWPWEKNKEDQLVVLNRDARSVIEECRGNGSPYVFAFKGRPIYRMYDTAWKNAWRKTGLPTDPKYCRGLHNLKHTFGRKLRATHVRPESRKVLLSHRTGDITTHYSSANIKEFIDAVEKVDRDENGHASKAGIGMKNGFTQKVTQPLLKVLCNYMIYMVGGAGFEPAASAV